MFAGEYAVDGTIAVKDLEKALTIYGKTKLSLEEARALCSQLETVDGKFNYRDYVTVMMS